MGVDSTKGIYDEQDRLLEYGNKEYGYDKNGCITAVVEGADTTHYVYDNLGNLTTILLPSGSVIDYITDANNRRVAKKIDGIITNQWIYSGELTPIAEIDTTGSISSRFIYGSKLNIPDYYVANDTTYKIISDHLGSLRLVINAANGEIAGRIDYDEYGNVLSQTGNAELPFGYAGGIYEPSTKLVRFSQRDGFARC